MKKVFTLVLVIGFVLGLGMFGCKSAKLQGSRYVNPGLNRVRVTCSQSQLSTTKVKEVKGVNNTKIAIEGQICLSGEITTVSGEANVLFIIDKSNSMQYADKSFLGQCSRKDAVKKVINATTGGKANNNIKGAIVTFGRQAKATNWTSLSSLSYSNVCGEGGSGSWSDDGGTNYEAAFEKAAELLKGKSGMNIIYFITDGAPSLTNSSNLNSGNDWSGGQSAGRTAMNKLRNSVSDLTVNAVYLVDPKLSTYDDGAPSESDTYDYLVSIVGNANNVKKADHASDLVEKISTFDTVPEGTFASTSDLSALVTVSGETSNVKIEELTHTSEGVYTYKLKEVALHGVSGEVTENIFKVTGKGSNGETSTSTVIIKFTRTN